MYIKKSFARLVIFLYKEESPFTKEAFDNIASSLSPATWINPHKSILGTGNYDINVITSAIESRGYSVAWFDRRKEIKTIDFDSVRG